MKTPAIDLFQAWFKDNGIRKRWFAGRIGVDSATISRWLSGAVRPTKSTRILIEKETSGAVPAEAWE